MDKCQNVKEWLSWLTPTIFEAGRQRVAVRLAHLDLEVQVRSRRVASGSDDAQLIPTVDMVADVDPDLPKWHVDILGVRAVLVLYQQVIGLARVTRDWHCG